MLLEILQLIELRAVAVGRQCQFALCSDAQPERRVGEYKLEYIPAFAQQLLAVLGADSGFIAAAEQSSQLSFARREGLPSFIYALTEVFRKKRQRERASALLDEFLCILISRAGFQRGFEVFEREVLAVEVIIRICHAVVPAVVAGEVLGVRLEQGDRLFV